MVPAERQSSVERVNHSFFLSDDGIYRCHAFQQFTWQSHGFGTRLANPVADVTLRQIHSSTVWNAQGLVDRSQQGDALITNEPGLRIGVRTADCVPILLLDSRQRAVAAVHAGWRGSAVEIVRSAIEKMMLDFHSNPSDLYAAIGPCIRECCYEVGAEVAQRFKPVPPETTPGKFHLNLPEANVGQMTSVGVPRAQIFDSGLCTSCQIDMFHSFRRQPHDPGRMITMISKGDFSNGS
jgi:YfiH family protein